VEDKEVDLMLLVGRTYDFGEICDGLAPWEPGETSVEATGDPSRVLSMRNSVLRNGQCEEEGEAQEAFDGTGRFQTPRHLLCSLHHR
jgi:hypothetical protein